MFRVFLSLTIVLPGAVSFGGPNGSSQDACSAQLESSVQRGIVQVDPSLSSRPHTDGGLDSHALVFGLTLHSWKDESDRVSRTKARWDWLNPGNVTFADSKLEPIDGVEIPVLVGLARVGLVVEAFRREYELRFVLNRLKGKKVQDIFGTYLGADFSAYFIFGWDGRMAVNSKGVVLSQINTGDYNTSGVLGMMGAGVGIPIVQIRPDYDRLPEDDPLWDQVL